MSEPISELDARVHEATCMQCNCSAGRTQVLAHMQHLAQRRMTAQPQAQLTNAQPFTQMRYENALAAMQQQVNALQAQAMANAIEDVQREVQAEQAKPEPSAPLQAWTEIALEWLDWLRATPRYPQPHDDEARDEIPHAFTEEAFLESADDESRELVGV